MTRAATRGRLGSHTESGQACSPRETGRRIRPWNFHPRDEKHHESTDTNTHVRFPSHFSRYPHVISPFLRLVRQALPGLEWVAEGHECSGPASEESRDSDVLLGAPAGGKCRPSPTGTGPRGRRPGPGQRSCRAPARAPWRGPSTLGCWARDGVNGVKDMQPTGNPEEPKRVSHAQRMGARAREEDLILPPPRANMWVG